MDPISPPLSLGNLSAVQASLDTVSSSPVTFSGHDNTDHNLVH